MPSLVLEFQPELRELDRLIDDDEIVRGTPVEVVLRLLVVRRRDDWSDAQTAHSASLTLVS